VENERSQTARRGPKVANMHPWKGVKILADFEPHSVSNKEQVSGGNAVRSVPAASC